jgi:hypothetical protein
MYSTLRMRQEEGVDREARNARIVRAVRAELDSGASYDAATLRVARAFKLGRGAAQYVRKLVPQEGD